MKREVGDCLNIIKVDAEKNADAAIKYQVRGVPTLILFFEGQIIWKKTGVLQMPQLKAIIEQKLDEQQE